MPASADNIERTPPVARDVLERCFLGTGTPVIVLGLAPARTRVLADPVSARRAFGRVVLPAGEPPIAQLLRGRSTVEARPVRYAQLYDDLTSGRRSLGACIEQPTPARVARRVPPPPYVGTGDRRDGWLSYMFMAGPGDVTQLHYDVDGRAFAMYQVFGHKRYVVIDPAHTSELTPVAETALPYVSTVDLQRLDPDRRAALLRRTRAWEAVVGPGETIVIPSGAWHHVEYLTPALSVSFRLPRSPALRFLADELPPGIGAQALIAHFRGSTLVGDDAVALAALRSAVARVDPRSPSADRELAATMAEQSRRLGLLTGPYADRALPSTRRGRARRSMGASVVTPGQAATSHR